MARAATRLERLDDQHAAAAMRAGMGKLIWKRWVLAACVLG
jgi:hypothetical protein